MDILRMLAELHDQRDRLNQAIEALVSLNASAPAVPQPAKFATKPAAHVGVNGAKTASVAPSVVGKRVVSQEARQRMADAQKKRYAKAKRAVKAAAKKAAVPPVAKTSAKAAPVASPGVEKVGKLMSEATKKKLAVAAKARWAAKNTAAKA